MTFTSHYNSPLGAITLASNGEALTGLWFDGQKFFGSILESKCENRGLPVLEQARKWLDIYFGGKEPDFSPKLHFIGTPFRQRVWKLLQTVPYGQTATYKTIAEEFAKERGLGRFSAQAIGGAVAHNPISIIVPCHRIVGCDGNLIGYAGGIERKTSLLKLEGTDMTGLFIQKDKH